MAATWQPAAAMLLLALGVCCLLPGGGRALRPDQALHPMKALHPKRADPPCTHDVEITCLGNECCPRATETQNRTYPCLSAAPGWNGCETAPGSQAELGLRGPTGTDEHPINAFNDQLDSLAWAGSGFYYEFDTVNAELILHGEVEGKTGNWFHPSTVLPLASSTKLWTGFAAMMTMELKPTAFYPNKTLNSFKGWEEFGNFRVHGSENRANLTIHHLLTHTSGLPFTLRSSKEDLTGIELFFEPGTAFGYTLGHRVAGWLLRDFWREQPEASGANLQTVQDVYKWLVFDRMGTSSATKFNNKFTELFGYEGDAGDAAMQSSGEDMMKLAVVALRRGQKRDGTRLISEQNWNKWAVPNLLPGGKLSEDLVDWEGPAATWKNWNFGGVKEKQIMKQHGAYGWNYFGATYKDSVEIGWCGFYSCCLRVSYPRDVAFIMMQRDIFDNKKSKPYLDEHFDEMAKSLECANTTCGESSSVFCEKCDSSSSGSLGSSSTTRTCKDMNRSTDCPRSFSRTRTPTITFSRKGIPTITSDTRLDADMHVCYVPACPIRNCTNEEQKYHDAPNQGLGARMRRQVGGVITTRVRWVASAIVFCLGAVLVVGCCRRARQEDESM